MIFGSPCGCCGAPGFAVLAIVCLTLGIGANTAVFSWIEGILLRPFPAVAHQDRLMVLGGTARGASLASAVSWPGFLDYQALYGSCHTRYRKARASWDSGWRSAPQRRICCA